MADNDRTFGNTREGGTACRGPGRGGGERDETAPLTVRLSRFVASCSTGQKVQLVLCWKRGMRETTGGRREHPRVATCM